MVGVWQWLGGMRRVVARAISMLARGRIQNSIVGPQLPLVHTNFRPAALTSNKVIHNNVVVQLPVQKALFGHPFMHMDRAT